MLINKENKNLTFKTSLIVFIVLFVVLINLFNYAALVSDDDSSSLVTKSEFNTIKSEFDTRIDEYKGALDNRIDSAIEAYLAGVKLESKTDNLFEKFVSASGGKPKWYKDVKVGVNSVSDFTLNGVVTIYGKICSNLRCYMGYGGSAADTQLHIGGEYTQGHYQRPWCWYSRAVQGSVDANWHTISLWKNNSYNITQYPPTYAVKTWNKTIHQNSNGSGERWVSQRIGNYDCLKYYCNNFYIQNVVTFNSYYYFYKQINETDKGAYLNDNGKSVESIILPSYTIMPVAGATITVGNEIGPSDETSDAKISFFSTMIKVTDGNNYLDAFWSIDNNEQIYVYDEDYNGDVSNTKETYNVASGTFEDFFYRMNGANVQTNNYPSYSFDYYPIELRDSDVKNGIQSYCNNTSSTLVGEPVYNGGGMPFAETTDINRKIKVKIKLSSATDAVCNVKISDKQFVLGEFATGANQFVNEDVNCNLSDYKTFDFLVPPRGYLWLYLKNKTNNDVVTIEDIQIIDE